MSEENPGTVSQASEQEMQNVNDFNNPPSRLEEKVASGNESYVKQDGDFGTFLDWTEKIIDDKYQKNLADNNAQAKAANQAKVDKIKQAPKNILASASRWLSKNSSKNGGPVNTGSHTLGA